MLARRSLEGIEATEYEPNTTGVAAERSARPAHLAPTICPRKPIPLEKGVIRQTVFVQF